MFNFNTQTDLEIEWLKERLKVLESKENPKYTFKTGDRLYRLSNGQYIAGGFDEYKYIPYDEVINMILTHLKLELKYEAEQPSKVTLQKVKNGG